MSTHEADPRIQRLLARDQARDDRIWGAMQEHDIAIGTENPMKVLRDKGLFLPQTPYSLVLAPLCDAFYLGNREKRQRIFDCVHDPEHKSILYAMRSMTLVAADRIRTSTSKKQRELWLRRGLTAFVIENMGIDGRDSVVWLGELNKAAEEHKLPRDTYRKVAEKDLRIEPKGAMTGWTVRSILLGRDAE